MKLTEAMVITLIITAGISATIWHITSSMHETSIYRVCMERVTYIMHKGDDPMSLAAPHDKCANIIK